MVSRSGSRVYWLLLLGLAAWALAAAGGRLLQMTAVGKGLELRAYDLRFQLRGTLPPPADPEIVLLTLDDESFDRLEKPLLLWQGELGQVIKGLAAAGARVAAVDLLLPEVSEIDPEGQRELIEALLTAPALGMPVILAYRVRQGAVDQPSMPLAMAAGDESFGFINLTTDSDDFVRRQELVAVVEDGELRPSWSLLIAQRLQGESANLPRNGPLLINYLGRSPFRKVPFWRVLEAVQAVDQEFLSREFGAAAVLVGLDGDEDRHATPLYFQYESGSASPSRRTLGLEIHGHTVSTLLSGRFIERAPPTVQWLGILGLSGLVIVAVAVFNPVPASIIAAAAGLTYTWLSLGWTFRQGIWLDLVAPLGAAGVGLAAAYAGRYVVEGREKRKLRRLFQRYVSPAVVADLLQRPEALVLTGELREVTVLFADIRGFTSLSEQLSAPDVVSRLNRYFAEMVMVIHGCGGMVDKFIGDAIMAVFGAPLTSADHPEQAVRAALGMQAALERLNRSWASEGLPPLRIGIGVHTGEAVIGNVGSPERLDYTVIGDVVNTASRLESLTKERNSALLISLETRSRLCSEEPWADLGEVHLKGKATAVRVYGRLS